MGKKKFDGMPPELQSIIQQSAQDMQTYEHNLFLQQEKELETS